MSVIAKFTLITLSVISRCIKEDSKSYLPLCSVSIQGHWFIPPPPPPHLLFWAGAALPLLINQAISISIVF